MGNKQKYSKRHASAGFTVQFFVPPGATDIRFLVRGVAVLDDEWLDVRYDSAANIKKAYKAYGTIFNVVYTPISVH